MDLDRRQVCCWSTYITRVVNFIAAYRRSGLMHLCFVGLQFDNKLSVCDILSLIGGNLVFVDEVDCVGAGDLTTNSMCKLPKHVGSGVLPHITILRVSN